MVGFNHGPTADILDAAVVVNGKHVLVMVRFKKGTMGSKNTQNSPSAGSSFEHVSAQLITGSTCSGSGSNHKVKPCKLRMPSHTNWLPPASRCRWALVAVSLSGHCCARGPSLAAC